MELQQHYLLSMCLNPDFECLAHSFLTIKQTKIVLHTPNFAHVNSMGGIGQNLQLQSDGS